MGIYNHHSYNNLNSGMFGGHALQIRYTIVAPSALWPRRFGNLDFSRRKGIEIVGLDYQDINIGIGMSITTHFRSIQNHCTVCRE